MKKNSDKGDERDQARDVGAANEEPPCYTDRSDGWEVRGVRGGRFTGIPPHDTPNMGCVEGR